MWPFKKKKSVNLTSLREQAATVQETLKHAFDSPGPLYNDERRRIMSAWFDNFARNLGAAVAAVETGKDMAGQPIQTDAIRMGLTRMCDEYGKAEMIKRLEDVCGVKVRNRFETVLSEVRSAASSGPTRGYKYTCGSCKRNTTIRDSHFKALSDQEKAIWAKSSRGHSQVGQLQNYRKIVCPKCNCGALVDKTKLTPA